MYLKLIRISSNLARYTEFSKSDDWLYALYCAKLIGSFDFHSRNLQNIPYKNRYNLLLSPDHCGNPNTHISLNQSNLDILHIHCIRMHVSFPLPWHFSAECCFRVLSKQFSSIIPLRKHCFDHKSNVFLQCLVSFKHNFCI